MNLIKEHLLGWKRPDDDVFAHGRVVVHNSLRVKGNLHRSLSQQFSSALPVALISEANEDGDTAYTLVVGSTHIPLHATMQLRPTLPEFYERQARAPNSTLSALCSAVNDVGSGESVAAATDNPNPPIGVPPLVRSQPLPPGGAEPCEGRTLRRSSSFSFLRSLSRSRSSSRAPSPAKDGADSHASSSSPPRRSGSFSFSFAGVAPPVDSASPDCELTVVAKDGRSVALNAEDAAVFERWHVALREALADLLFARCFRLCRRSPAAPGEEPGLELSLRKLEIGLLRGALLLPPQHCHLLRARRLRNVKLDLVEIARRLRDDAQCLSDEEVRAFLKRADCDRLVLLDADFVRLQALARAHVFLPAAALQRLRYEGHVDVPLLDAAAVDPPPSSPVATPQRRSGRRPPSPIDAASPGDPPIATGDAAPATPDALFLVSISSPRTTQTLLAPPSSPPAAATGSSQSSRRSARLSTPPQTADLLASPAAPAAAADDAAVWQPRPSATPAKLPSPGAVAVANAAVHRQLQRCLRELRRRRLDAASPPSPVLRCDALFVTPSASVDVSGLSSATATAATHQATQVTPSLAQAAAAVDGCDADEPTALRPPSPPPRAAAARRYDATVAAESPPLTPRRQSTTASPSPAADGDSRSDALFAVSPSPAASPDETPLTPSGATVGASSSAPSPASLANVSPLTSDTALQDEATSTDDLPGFLAAQPLRFAAPELAQIDEVLDLLDELSQSASASLSQAQRPPSVVFVGGGGGGSVLSHSVLSAGGVSGLFDAAQASLGAGSGAFDDASDVSDGDDAAAATPVAASANSSGVLHYSRSLLGDSLCGDGGGATLPSPAAALLPWQLYGDSPAAAPEADDDLDDLGAVLGRLRFPSADSDAPPPPPPVARLRSPGRQPLAAALATSPLRRSPSPAKLPRAAAAPPALADGDAFVESHAENDARGGNGASEAASPAKRSATRRRCRREAPQGASAVDEPPPPPSALRLHSALASARDRVSLLSDRIQRVRCRLRDAPLDASEPPPRPLAAESDAVAAPAPPTAAASPAQPVAAAAATWPSLGAVVAVAALALCAWLVFVGHRATVASDCPRAALCRPPSLALRSPTMRASPAASIAAQRCGRFALPPALRTAPPSLRLAPPPDADAAIAQLASATPVVERLVRDALEATAAKPNGAAVAARLLRSVRVAVTRGVWRLVSRAVAVATLMPPEHQQLLFGT